MTDFLDLGNRRNELAHSNIAFQSFGLTFAELESRFRSAHHFVAFLLNELGLVAALPGVASVDRHTG